MGDGRAVAAARAAEAERGHPRLPDRAARSGILFVLKSGLPWEMLPAEVGCGSGMNCWRRLRDWQKAAGCGRRCTGCCWNACRLQGRSTSTVWHELRICSSQGGGSATGPNPTDRGKPGAKRHIVVDARGTPLGVCQWRLHSSQIGRLNILHFIVAARS